MRTAGWEQAYGMGLALTRLVFSVLERVCDTHIHTRNLSARHRRARLHA
jgi:hypothetical protein